MACGPTISIDNSGLIATPYTPATTIEGRLADLRQFIQNRLPGTAGIHPVRAEDLVVYYDGSPKCASRIDLGNASEEDLAALANACDTGGETASGRTMDSTKFATRFDVVTSGLIDMISGDVLQGENVDKSLRAELSHMNVYGSGECGEPQQNISHRDSMIGSLAVIFPTVHAGGRLTISHENTPLFYDPSTALSAAGTSAVTYLALYDKVSSTMAPIDNGYRIELVYNLSLTDRDSAGTVGTPMIHNPSATERLLEDRIQDLLAHPNFLPVGGFLAVGLAHKYAMPSPVAGNEPGAHYENGRLVIPQTPARWDSVLKSLKGIDARMRMVFQRIGLTPSVKLLYSDPEERDDVLLDEIADLSGIHEGVFCFGPPELAMEKIRRLGTALQRDSWRMKELEPIQALYRQAYLASGNASVTKEEGTEEHLGGSITQVGEVVHWLADLGEKNQVHTAYPQEDHMCGDKPGTAALLIPVPAFGDGLRQILV